MALPILLIVAVGLAVIFLLVGGLFLIWNPWIIPVTMISLVAIFALRYLTSRNKRQS